jgi:hypothetical protein
MPTSSIVVRSSTAAASATRAGSATVTSRSGPSAFRSGPTALVPRSIGAALSIGTSPVARITSPDRLRTVTDGGTGNTAMDGAIVSSSRRRSRSAPRAPIDRSGRSGWSIGVSIRSSRSPVCDEATESRGRPAEVSGAASAGASPALAIVAPSAPTHETPR